MGNTARYQPPRFGKSVFRSDGIRQRESARANKNGTRDGMLKSMSLNRAGAVRDAAGGLQMSTQNIAWSPNRSASGN
jgi:hypothetical protein